MFKVELVVSTFNELLAPLAQSQEWGPTIFYQNLVLHTPINISGKFGEDWSSLEGAGKTFRAVRGVRWGNFYTFII